jgi:hypothetical protein
MSLRSIVMDNWDIINSSLNLNITKKDEHMLLMLSHFTPLLEKSHKTFSLPSVASYYSADYSAINSLELLREMGFVEKLYTNSYGLSSKGVELMNCYKKGLDPNFLTSQELTKKILDRK